MRVYLCQFRERGKMIHVQVPTPTTVPGGYHRTYGAAFDLPLIPGMNASTAVLPSFAETNAAYFPGILSVDKKSGMVSIQDHGTTRIWHAPEVAKNLDV